MFKSRNMTQMRDSRRSGRWLLIAAAVSLAVAGVLFASLMVGPASANEPAALPSAGGAQGAEAAGNMAFVLAAAALAVGTVVFVGSAKKGQPEAQKAESENGAESTNSSGGDE